MMPNLGCPSQGAGPFLRCGVVARPTTMRPASAGGTPSAKLSVQGGLGLGQPRSGGGPGPAATLRCNRRLCRPVCQVGGRSGSWLGADEPQRALGRARAAREAAPRCHAGHRARRSEGQYHLDYMPRHILLAIAPKDDHLLCPIEMQHRILPASLQIALIACSHFKHVTPVDRTDNCE